MNRNRTHFRESTRRRPVWLPAICAAVMLSACGDRPPGPQSPKPPKPEVVKGYVITAELLLPARPVMPSPGPM